MRRLLVLPALLAGIVSSSAAQGSAPREPRLGTPERTQIVDAVRRAVGNATRYRIDHLRATPRWAFFSGTEVVPVDERTGELQETDLSVQALLERDRTGRWRVVDRWSLPDEERAPRSRFVARMRLRVEREALPRALFPPDLLE